MTELDRLPPDQRAVLSLVLDRGKSYAEVAALLSIPEATVRDRAQTALDTLARAGEPAPGPSPRAHEPPPSDGAHAGEPTSGPSPRAHEPTSGDGGRTANHAPIRSGAADGPPGASRHPGSGGVAADPPPPPSAAAAGGPSRQLPSSRLGGALLLGALVVATVVVVIVLGGGKGSSGSGGTTSPVASSAAKTTSSSPAPSAKIENRLTLSPAEPESRAAGEAYVLSDGSRHAFYVAAKKLPPSKGFFYAVWLYNSPSSSAPLGRAPTVGSDGRLEGGGPLPSNAADYAKLIVTRETSTHAAHPGPIVLSGSFSLR